MLRSALFFTILLLVNNLFGQQNAYWQQKADYKIKVDFDDKKHKYEGEEWITYTNLSPDTLNRLFFHLYYNAFQPNSMMDVRSRSIVDPDRRVGDRISKLDKDQIGYMHITEIEMDGKKLKNTHEEGTIFEIVLDDFIAPGQEVKLKLKFEAQVPVQIRRSGRNNAEGIDYSMAQWYPKLSEYDVQGWHANPYVAREFYGVWGNFDIEIKINSKFVIGATGVLQNPEEIGHGYAADEPKNKPKKLEWKFKAENVHDFVWAADPDYKHLKQVAPDGTELHFFYQPGEKTSSSWEALPAIMSQALPFMNARYGKYPYPVYSFIQAGDGGMEYPMATLITGNRPINSLVGVAVHEWMHSWYQMILGTNESLYPWMDEGFTSFASTETMDFLVRKGLISGKAGDFIFKPTMDGFGKFTESGMEEAISTHSDHYTTNTAYSVGSYTKGELALVQLNYIVGKEVFDRALLRYFNDWKFKHPTPNDFIRVFEKESNLELDWFKEYWVYTTKTIDYAVDTLMDKNLMLSNRSLLPMPLDVLVTLKNGKKHLYYIPQSIMRGEKKPDVDHDSYTICKDWDWTHPTYMLQIEEKNSEISSIEIDPSYRMMDVNRENNFWKAPLIE